MQPDLKVVFQDSAILVVDKPPHLLSSSLRGKDKISLEQILKEQFLIDLDKGGLVHRLDQDTSGLMVVAKDAAAKDHLSNQFQSRQVKKEYWALVHGELNEPGLIDVAIAQNPKVHDQFVVSTEGKVSATRYEPIKSLQFTVDSFQSIFKDLKKKELSKLRTLNYQLYTLLRCFPLTGRTHQIRIHLKYINHPIVSDWQYVGRKIYKLDSTWCPRLFLHAKKIGFHHPRTGEWMEFETDLAEDLSIVLKLFSD